MQLFLKLSNLRQYPYFFFLNDPAPTETSPLPLPAALPISCRPRGVRPGMGRLRDSVPPPQSRRVPRGTSRPRGDSLPVGAWPLAGRGRRHQVRDRRPGNRARSRRPRRARGVRALRALAAFPAGSPGLTPFPPLRKRGEGGRRRFSVGGAHPRPAPAGAGPRHEEAVAPRLSGGEPPRPDAVAPRVGAFGR